MHEFSLMADLMRKIEAVGRASPDAQITAVKVQLGALCHISPQHFRQHFRHAAQGSLVESAQLEIELLTDIDDPAAQAIVLASVELAV